MNDPVHTLEDILQHGRATFHVYDSGKVFYAIKVYGPRDRPSRDGRTPYDIPTTYIFPVNLSRHNRLDKEVLPVILEAELVDAMKDKNLSVIRGGVQTNQHRAGITY